jgi:hypothetical protein
VARSCDHHGGRGEYTRDEVLRTLVHAREALGVWLSGNEWTQYGVIRREAARAAGLPEPRIPSLTPINRLFGRYANAREEARISWGGDPEPAATELIERIVKSDSTENEGDSIPDTHADALTRRLWSVVRHLSEVDLSSIYASLAELCAGGAESPRARLCRNALIACQHDRPE